MIKKLSNKKIKAQSAEEFLPEWANQKAQKVQNMEQKKSEYNSKITITFSDFITKEIVIIFNGGAA